MYFCNLILRRYYVVHDLVVVGVGPNLNHDSYRTLFLTTQNSSLRAYEKTLFFFYFYRFKKSSNKFKFENCYDGVDRGSVLV